MKKNEIRADTTLVFDWGQTLMKEFEEYEGSMVDWPVVAEMPGVSIALEKLSRKYQMAVGTNAQYSTAAQVRGALDRVKIGGYFSSVFTFHELHARKPDTQFFKGIEHYLEKPSNQMIMIGDSFSADVLGAKNSGWKAVWYNPDCQPCPGLLPAHDTEIHSMEDLPDILEKIKYPDLGTCLIWYQSENVTAALLIHVYQVAACAYQMALWLAQKGMAVNPILAHRGGLLHDLKKLDKQKEIDHGQAAGEWLQVNHQPELAKIASSHMLFSVLDNERRPESWEQKLVYLADKMVEKNQIVSIEERLDGLKARYKIDGNDLNEIYPCILSMREDFCGIIGIRPNELAGKLREAAK